MAISRRYPIGCTLGLILGGLACQAMAEPPAASNDNGLMTFKNVRVVNAPNAATEQKPAAAPSVQAFIDPVTGALRPATPEEARQLAAVTSARTRSDILANSGATTASTDDSERLIYGPDNAVGLLLGEEAMVLQKAHLDANGELIQECISGEDDAAHAAATHTQQGHTQQESHNDR